MQQARLIMWRLSLVGVLLSFVLVLVAAGAAQAQSVRMYATFTPADEVYHGPLIIPNDTPTTLHLWLEGGSTPSSGIPCSPGETGDEVCGYSFVVEAASGFVFNGYVGDATFDSSGAEGPPPRSFAPGRVSSNAFDLGTPLVANRHLGSLTVTALSPTPNDVVSASGSVVNAGLGLGHIAALPLILPEPGFGSATSLAALALLALGRRGRSVRPR